MTTWAEKKFILGFIGLIALVACIGAKRLATPPPPAPITAPAPQREFRGMWVATLENIDWPSRKDLPTHQQKAELVAIMDRAVKLNFNAVILQVRPTCDALYDSRIEPWSEYLTGQQGKAPWPYYDPLAFAVAEAHKRGLELHAYFNPYRVRFRNNSAPVSPKHISKTRPDLVRAYGKFLWLDPSEKATRDYSLSVIMDVVRRYDIDAVHFDDYFYPYRDLDRQGREIEFPDDANWRRYQSTGGKLSRSDWRRQNVDTFVESVYRSIKAEKPWVKFGISPFGIWRPGYPPQITGTDAYEKLSADSRKWLACGWVDYLAPQLYWPIAKRDQSFPVLLKWWGEQNVMHRHLWPGISQLQEASEEIALVRKDPNASGEILWNSHSIFQNPAHIATFRRIYSSPALIPASPWLSSTPPSKPLLTYAKGWFHIKLSWKPGKNEKIARWVLQERIGGRWTTQIFGGDASGVQMRSGASAPDAFALYAVDRYGNPSPAVVVAGQ